MITDDGRIRAVLPTITALRDAGAAVIVMSHLGRPKGAPDPKYTLAPVATRLGELLGSPVAFAADTVGESAPRRPWPGWPPASVALLENLRFNPGETSKDDAERGAFADQLGRVRRRVRRRRVRRGAPQARQRVRRAALRLPHYAGGLVLREVEVLKRLTESPASRTSWCSAARRSPTSSP